MKNLLLSIFCMSVVTFSLGQSLLPKSAASSTNLVDFIAASNLPEKQKTLLLEGIKIARQKSKLKNAKVTATGDRLVHYSSYSNYGSFELNDTFNLSWSGSRSSEQSAEYLYGEAPNVWYESFDLAEQMKYESGTLKNKSKTMHTFDASGNMIEETNQYFNMSKSSWVNVSHAIVSYTGSSIADYINQEWDTLKSVWKNYSRNLYTYTPFGEIASFTLQYWDTGSAVWVNNYRYTDTYSGTVLQSRIAQTWDAAISSWVNSVYFQYNYTAGLNTGYVAHSWIPSTSAWQIGYRDTNTYAGSDLVETVHQTWLVSSSSWQNNYMDSFVRSGGKVIVNTRRNWDVVAGMWTTGSKSLFTYSGSNMTGLLAQQRNVTTNSWDNLLKIDYTYTGGNMTVVERASWNAGSGVWDNQLRKEFSFNANNSLIGSRSFDWIGGAWIPSISAEAIENYYYESYTGINLSPAARTDFSIFPNPATGDKVYVDYFTENQMTTKVVLANILGQQLYSFEEKGSIGDHSVIIPTADLVQGMYIVNIYNSDGLLRSLKMIK